MVKIVISKLRPPKGRTAGSKLAKTRVRSPSGQYREVFTIDANSPTFESDLTGLFKQNVADARRENKRLFGSVEGLAKAARPAKSRLDAVRKS
jgi:hypothetical protein